MGVTVIAVRNAMNFCRKRKVPFKTKEIVSNSSFSGESPKCVLEPYREVFTAKNNYIIGKS